MNKKDVFFHEMTKIIKLMIKHKEPCNLPRRSNYTLIAPLLSIFLMCSHTLMLRMDTVLSHTDETAKSLSSNSLSPSALKNIKIGKSGYYYIMDYEGTVIAHPNPSIEGINFSGIPMVNSILEKKSGCFIQFFDGMEKMLIFRNAEPHGILCFTITTDEVGGAKGECERIE